MPKGLFIVDCCLVHELELITWKRGPVWSLLLVANHEYMHITWMNVCMYQADIKTKYYKKCKTCFKLRSSDLVIYFHSNFPLCVHVEGGYLPLIVHLP